MHPKRSFPFDGHRFTWHHLNPFSSLAIHRGIGMLAFGIVGTFFPIFVFEFSGRHLPLLFTWMAFAYAIRLPMFYLGAKFFSKHGLRTSMILGLFLWTLYYLGGFLLDTGVSAYPDITLVLAFVFLGLFHGLYWAPFHVDFTLFSKKGHRGSEVSLIHILRLAIGIFIPVVGGLLISTFSYSSVFIIGMIVGWLSILPLLWMPNEKATYEFGARETITKVFDKKFRHLLISATSDGAQSAVAYIAWPVFLFIFFNGEYLDVGIVSAIIVLISLLLQWVLGKQIDKKTPNGFFIWGVRIYSLGWLAKAFVDSLIGVFVASTFHSFGAILLATPLETIYYQQSADAGHFVDEFSVIREIMLTIGRLGITVLLAITTLWLPLFSAFIIAAIITLFMSFLSKVHAAQEFGI